MNKQKKPQKKAPSSDSEEDDTMTSKMIKCIEKKFNELTNQLMKSFNEQIKELKKSVEFCCEKLDEYEEKNKNKEILIKQLQAENKEIKLHINKMEQNEKQNNIEIQGVPFKENENITNVFNNIIDILKCDKETINVTNIFRSKNKNPTNKNTAIVVSLQNKECKDIIIALKKKYGILNAKNINFEENNTIYINEQLTQFNKHLLYLAKSSRLGYKFIWAKNGKIWMRKNETSPILLIRTPEDIPSE